MNNYLIGMFLIFFGISLFIKFYWPAYFWQITIPLGLALALIYDMKGGAK